MAMQVLKRNRLFLAIPLLLFIMTVLIAFALLFFRQKSTVSQSAPLSYASGQISGAKREEQTTIDQGLNRESAKVARVIDGDTIEISAIGGPASGGEGGQRVRYIGIDTPETVDPRKAVQCFGLEAAAKNRELVEGKTVSLEKDVSETDKYGRLLRYVYFDNVFVNDYLIRQGYAYASSYPPDVRYQDQFTQAQSEAQQSGSGLWSACLANQRSTAVINQPSGICLIKGNISSSGEKIYHLQGQRYYNQTVIDESRGERWFCTQDDAVNAGWRKSKI